MMQHHPFQEPKRMIQPLKGAKASIKMSESGSVVKKASLYKENYVRIPLL